MPEGKLITFEGIDGCGKSTQTQICYERLSRDGLVSALFREPGGTNLGEKVRKILLDETDPLGGITELMLFSAARAELVRQVIKPLLNKGCVVILDRFIDSTTAYQGYGRGIDLDLIASINKASTQGIVPTATFLFDIEAGEALKRHERTFDRMESEGLEFMEKVRRGYLEIASKEARRITVLDGRMSIGELADKVWLKLKA